MTLPEHTRQPLGPNQERWLKALESGKFRQGQEVLRTDDNKFCCLGVACEVIGMKGRQRVTGGAWFYSNAYFDAPPKVVRALALFRPDGGSGNPEADALATLNDNGSSFKQIARIIRKDPSIYFKEPR